MLSGPTNNFFGTICTAGNADLIERLQEQILNLRDEVET